MMKHLSGYSKVKALGHRDILGILDDPVIVQEKIDGSQISFGVIGDEISIRSSGADIYPESPPKMFNKAVEQILKRKDILKVGYIYRGEYLSKPKHNTLAYERVPKDNIILFDIDAGGLCNYLSYEDVAKEAERIDLEVVPLLYRGKVTIDILKGFLGTPSILGGQNIEGVVVKNYGMFTGDKKTAMAKVVDTAFQEKHQKSWRENNPTRADIIGQIVETYRTEARWQKALQHLREEDRILGEPKDIGSLIAEVKRDVQDECEEEIKQKLYDYFWKDIKRRITHGLPEWYKEKLLELEAED
jgi:hypothetical protein